MNNMAEWFPMGTELKVVFVNAEEGYIIVRWKIPGAPEMTNEAALRPLSVEERMKK